MNERRVLFYLVILNTSSVFLVQTSFVPDEYWQSLEVAHSMVFGYGYLTWEWRNGLRSYSYPAIFAALYKALHILNLDYRLLVIGLPRFFQAICSAVGEWYIVKTACRLYGEPTAQWTFRSIVTSWFLFYCASRTMTNTMETALTSIALYFYPCIKMLSRRKMDPETDWRKAVLFMILAALTVIIRPTSIVLWGPLCMLHLLIGKNSWTILKLYLFIGSCAVLIMLLIDRFFYGYWICTVCNFMHFNVLSNQGTFYGSHSWHWYFSQGFPVIMGSHLILFLLEVHRRWKSSCLLLGLILFQFLIYSFISHKEFRFLLPILPFCHCIIGNYMASLKKMARTVYLVLIITNLPLCIYFGLIHQRGPLDTINFLASSATDNLNATFLFLMPCHSTPLYSHLHQNVPARFLTCEPNLQQLSNYIDEADRFYQNPKEFMNVQYGTRSKSHLPTHLIMFSSLENSLFNFIHNSGYKLCAQYFHSHFAEGRTGNFISVYCLRL